MKFRDLLYQVNPNLKHVPSGYTRYGSVVVLRSSELLEKNVGEAVKEVLPWCRSVYQHIDTIGEFRQPKLVYLAGEKNTVVHHRENGAIYIFDIAETTFSGGNRGLRERLVDVVNNGENLLDMFSAVGNLSLQPIIHKNINAILVEKNPKTFSYLLKTIRANKIDSVELINDDCRNLEIKDFADRIFMGFHDIDASHLKTAIKASKQKATIHLHPLVKRDEVQIKLDEYRQLLSELGVNVVDCTIFKVKNYAPNILHYEFVIRINK